MSKRLLLTGANGFTGRHFSRAARNAGYEVLPLAADLTNPVALAREIGTLRPDTVVHLAAISFVGHANPRAFYDVNVVGTTNLLDALCELAEPPDSVLLASSANVYGNSTQSIISEEQAVAPINHYATSKLAMEHMARTYLSKLPVFFVRPFNYTGPGQAASFVVPKMVKHFAQRAAVLELGNLEVEREINDVDFVCEAYLRLLSAAKPGDLYNVCSGQPVALRDILALLAQLSGHQLQVEVNPSFVRANEVRRLCGNPDRLIGRVGEIKLPGLKKTLDRMLSESLEKAQNNPLD